ncbi:MAG: hypothetical protein KDD38_03985 [Bdellovibrionales bacterium]|nr:hypothetical protein [Bdellovibrionales bacterium]
MKTKILYILAGFVFILGLALMGKAIYKISTRQTLVTEDGFVSAELREMRELDLQALKGLRPVTEDQLTKSLARYTTQNLPESEALIKKYIESDSLKVSAAALEASGAYEWADMQVYASALNSKNEELRLAALRGLAKRSDDARIFLVEKFMGVKPLTEKDWLFSRLTLLRLKSDPQDKKKIQAEVLSQLKNWQSELQAQALKGLLRAFPRDVDMSMVARAELIQPVSQVGLQAFQYLAAFDQEWLKNNFSKLSMPNDYTYQLVIIDFMSKHCPKNWQVLSDAIRKSPYSPDVIAHLNDAELGIKCALGL